MLHCKAARIQGQECLVPQSDQLVCKHAMEEEAPVGEEGYCWEHTKEQDEASDRLYVLQEKTKGQGFDDKLRDYMITGRHIRRKTWEGVQRRLNSALSSSCDRWRTGVLGW